MIHKSYKENGKAKINSCHDRDPFLINFFLLFFLKNQILNLIEYFILDLVVGWAVDLILSIEGMTLYDIVNNSEFKVNSKFSNTL